MYSNDDHHNLILFLKHGKLQLKYHLSDNLTSHIIFDGNQIINDGRKHNILISHQNSETIIDKHHLQISIPLSSSLFFDVLTIGGSRHLVSNEQFIGCFSNITYNHHPLLPEGILKSDRYDCFYDHNSICDRKIPCNHIQPLQFCGQIDCSLVCIPSSIDINISSLVQYSSQIKSGQYEQIYLTIFTTSANSTLFRTNNGSIQVSIILQVNSNKMISLELNTIEIL
jgi:hypothetical protein